MIIFASVNIFLWLSESKREPTFLARCKVPPLTVATPLSSVSRLVAPKPFLPGRTGAVRSGAGPLSLEILWFG